MKKTKVFLVDKRFSGATSGCRGELTLEHDGMTMFGGINVEAFLEEQLNNGARIKVSIEILERGIGGKRKCNNPGKDTSARTASIAAPMARSR